MEINFRTVNLGKFIYFFETRKFLLEFVINDTWLIRVNLILLRFHNGFLNVKKWSQEERGVTPWQDDPNGDPQNPPWPDRIRLMYIKPGLGKRGTHRESARETRLEKRVSFDWSIEDTCWQPRRGPALWLCISLRTHSGTPTSPMTESSGIVNGGTVGGWDREKAIEIRT